MKKYLFNLKFTLVLLFILAIRLSAQETIVKKGLVLDLNANKEVVIEDSDRVASWRNQVKGNEVDIFVKQDSGRDKKIKKKVLGVGSGRPTLKKDVQVIGGNSTIVFKEQELVNHQEDAFDHLVNGSGYTWFSVMCVYKQVKGKKDVNSFFGNLTNGKPYAGFWGNLTDDNRIWMGTRTGRDFGIKRKKGASPLWHAELNPQVMAKKPLKENKYYLVMGRMGAGKKTVELELFVNSTDAVDRKKILIKGNANPSKMTIGQERDAINHPGFESFHGEIARLLIYERPLTNEELAKVVVELREKYLIKE